MNDTIRNAIRNSAIDDLCMEFPSDQEHITRAAYARALDKGIAIGHREAALMLRSLVFAMHATVDKLCAAPWHESPDTWPFDRIAPNEREDA